MICSALVPALITSSYIQVIHGYSWLFHISCASLVPDVPNVPAFQVQDLWLLLRLYRRSPYSHNNVALQQMPIASVDLAGVVEDLQVDLRQARSKVMTVIK